jgi:hypothetical protein
MITEGLTYLKYFLHLLHFFPVFVVKAEISILFSFEGWDFLTIISQLNKQVYTLRNSISINT